MFRGRQSFSTAFVVVITLVVSGCSVQLQNDLQTPADSLSKSNEQPVDSGSNDETPTGTPKGLEMDQESQLESSHRSEETDLYDEAQNSAESSTEVENSVDESDISESDTESEETEEPEEKVLASPFANPWPLDFIKQDLTDAALDNARTYMANASSTRTVKVVFEEGFPDSEKAWISRIAEKSVNAYPMPSGLVPLVVVGTTDAFVSETIALNGFSHQGGFPCGRETTYETYCAESNWAALNYMASAKNPREFNSPGKKAVIAHEIFHVWQLSIHSSEVGRNFDPNSPQGLPVWLNEGLANFVGFAVAQIYGVESYQPGRDRQVVNYMTNSSVPLSEHRDWQHDPYGIGMAASEYLVASVGLEKVLNIWFELQRGKSFSDAFGDAVGIELTEFYQIFEQIRDKTY